MHDSKGVHTDAQAEAQTYCVPAGVGDEENEEAAMAALKLNPQASSAKEGAVVQWRQREDGGLELQHSHSLRQLTWHSRGDYFATVAPTGNTQV